MLPVFVRVLCASDLAMPKSDSLTSPEKPTSTLCGETSRWTRPSAASVLAPLVHVAQALQHLAAQVQRQRRREHVAGVLGRLDDAAGRRSPRRAPSRCSSGRLPPRSGSVTTLSKSNTVTRFACCSWAAVRASLTNSFSSSGSPLNDSRMNFSATGLTNPSRALGARGPDLRHAAHGNALAQHVLADALTWLHGIDTPGPRPEVKRGSDGVAVRCDRLPAARGIPGPHLRKKGL